MIWLAIIALGAVAFAAAAFMFNLPRTTWTLFAATLLFGLTGYAVQGRPDQPASPRAADRTAQSSGELLIAQRRAFFTPDQPLPRYLNLADGFARKGQYANAADFLTLALDEQPEDAEAWIALGNVLVEHADGTLTPAAGEAYQRAGQFAPDSPAAPYFLGVAMLRNGQFGDASGLWRQALDMAQPDAQYYADLELRVTRLEALLAQISAPRDGTVAQTP